MPLCHYAIMSLCHYVIMPLCHYVIMLLCDYVIVLLCHYVIMPLCHYVIIIPVFPTRAMIGNNKHVQKHDFTASAQASGILRIVCQIPKLFSNITSLPVTG